MRAVVKNVAKYFPTAIISGRSRDKVIDRPLFTFINCKCKCDVILKFLENLGFFV